MDVFDDATKTISYTVLKGDPRYKYFAASFQFSPGPREGSTTAVWVARYVPQSDMGPPEHVKGIIMLVWKALADAAMAAPAPSA